MRVGGFVVYGHDLAKINLIVLDVMKVGDLLDLTAEPDNSYDQYAIKVSWRGIFIGYIPNKGLTCNDCAHGCRSRMKYCSNCGSTNLHPKGLAYRIHLLDLLKEEYVCFVKEILKTKTPIKAEIWLGTIDNEY